jgi:EpsI family protein
LVIIFQIQYKQPAQKINPDISKIPLNLGEWQGEDIAIDNKTKDILETESVLMRKYVKGKNSIWLAIVYYKDSRVALHLPESCYTGQGSHIVKRDREDINIPGLKNFYANKLILKGNKGNQAILYYFETGDLRTSSYQTMRWQMMLNKLKSKSNSGALVRFSALSGPNPDETLKILKQFIKEISPLLSKYLI